ncbi:hypothetical protein Ancab_011847 [Ancistrocladus abbreviatus]
MAFFIQTNLCAPILHYCNEHYHYHWWPEPCKISSFSSYNYVLFPRTSASIFCTLNARHHVNLPQQKHVSPLELITAQSFRGNQLVNGLSIDELIKEYTGNGDCVHAIRLYIDRIFVVSAFDGFSAFPTLLKAVGELCDVELGKQVHGHLLKLGVLDDIYVANSLLGMFWKSGVSSDAVTMFEKMRERDAVSWNTMISGFYHSRQYVDSLEWFHSMVQEFGMYPGHIACISALSSCSLLGCLNCGREIHAYVVKSGLDSHQFVVNGLVEMYMKNGSVKFAERIFNRAPENLSENIVLWNVMILGYAGHGYFLSASLLFAEMMALGIEPDSATIVAVLVLSSKSSNLALGKQIHAIILSNELELDVRVQTALIDMYCNCGDVESGLKLFARAQDCNLVMWGAMVSNCARNGYSREALDLYVGFRFDNGLVDSVILLAALRACSSLNSRTEGMEIHGLAVKLGLDCDMHISGALLDMYVKSTDIESAQKVFERVQVRDVVSWNSMISGYAESGYVDEALKAFYDMQSQEIKPNAVTISCILSICSHKSISSLCREIHGYVMRQGFESNVLVNNSLIAAYAKCGDIKCSSNVFDKMNERDAVSWNSIIHGLGLHGHTGELFALLGKMKAVGFMPDHITFTSILFACSHSGRLEEGRKFFRCMIEEYKLEPKLEQYTCMVDLLGRGGYLEEAYDVIAALPCSPDHRVWGSLLGSCRVHGNKRVAEMVSHRIFELDPSNTGYRVLLTNLYEDFGKHNEVDMIRSNIKDMGLKKSPGCSWIEVKSKMHVFTACDQSHNQVEDIYDLLNCLTLEIVEAGYIPQFW